MSLQQFFQLLPIILVFGLPILARLLQKAAEMREKQRQAAEEEERRLHSLRTGENLGRTEAQQEWSPGGESTTPAQPQRASVADELARRRQQALEELRKRQRGGQGQQRSQRQTSSTSGASRGSTASTASQPTPQRSTASRPQQTQTSGRTRPAPASGRTRIADQQMPRRSSRRQEQEAEAPELREARERIAAARARIEEEGMRGLNVRLDTIDPHYVRKQEEVGIDPIQLDARSIRQALVMSELLAPPMALRDPESTTTHGPPGLA